MKRRISNEQTIQEVIREFLDGSKIKGKLAEIKVINQWEEMVGSIIAKNTQKIYFHHGKLILHIESAPLRNELNYSRSKIVQIVNECAGMELIDDVVVR